MARRRRPSTTSRTRRRRTLVLIPPAPSPQGTASTRPAYCPAPAVIDAKLAALRAYFATHPDSDDRAAAVDGYIASVPTGCTNARQDRAFQEITRSLAGQAHEEEASLRWPWQALWEDQVLPVLKIAAGGAGLLVVGGALVYVAGRYSKPGKAVTGAAGIASKVTKAPVSAIRRRRSTVSDAEYFERRGMERAARQMPSPKPRTIEGLGRLPRKRTVRVP